MYTLSFSTDTVPTYALMSPQWHADVTPGEKIFFLRPKGLMKWKEWDPQAITTSHAARKGKGFGTDEGQQRIVSDDNTRSQRSGPGSTVLSFSQTSSHQLLRWVWLRDEQSAGSAHLTCCVLEALLGCQCLHEESECGVGDNK